jgi:hypothetical protein
MKYQSPAISLHTICGSVVEASQPKDRGGEMCPNPSGRPAGTRKEKRKKREEIGRKREGGERRREISS